MIRHISAVIKKSPLLFRTLRPAFYYFFNAYNVLSTRAAIWRARMVNARFPRMDDAATGESWKGRRIGARAAGRQIVMLVVSDLRVDPRVEREARALASAGYIVTVICPELSEGAGATYNLDWGQGVFIRYIAPAGSAFMNRKPGYYADLLYFAAVRMKPLAFHAHDLSTAFAALAAARV